MSFSVSKLLLRRTQFSISTANYLFRTLYNDSLQGKTTRIGCASGFWGDSAVSVPQLVHKGKIDFLVFDYLSEITMSLLTAVKQKNPSFGYAPDFIQSAMAPSLKQIKAKGIRVVSNAGGVNPSCCAEALREVCAKSGLNLKIAVIDGDNLISKKSDLIEEGVKEIFTKKPLPESVSSINAYLGATAISRALDLGADVVITGRCVDSALILGPLMHTFGWKKTDYDLLSAGSLAGHLIECGAQSTGGIFTDWQNVPDWHNIGFPVVECSANGDFVLTKPEKTGGLVSIGTASEQLVYEIGDPKNYLLPDVTCDWSEVIIKEIEGFQNEAVFVSGAKGHSPSDSYKVCSTYFNGYRSTAVVIVRGPNSVEKARKTANEILLRMETIFKTLKMDTFLKTNVEILGAEESYGSRASKHNPKEAVLWIAVHHKDKAPLELFGREIAPAGTGMAPGLCGIIGGRPKPSPVFMLYSFLYPKENIKISITVDEEPVEHITEEGESTMKSTNQFSDENEFPNPPCSSGTHSFSLDQLAFTRSGDKGNNVNIGVVARHPSILPYLKAQLTCDRVKEHLITLFKDSPDATDQIQRFELPGIHSLNFVLHNALGGGGIASLRSDPQGKSAGQMLLDFQIKNVPNLLAEIK